MTMVSEVSNDLASGLSRRIQPTFGYYRQPNGWLTTSPITRFERVKYIEQGWVCLDTYGFFDMTSYTASHPFEGLFMFGGAKEMSIEQILQTGLYIDPPLVPRCKQHLTQLHRSHTKDCWRGAQKVEFPQLAGIAPELIGPFICDFCQRKMATPQAREQHQSVAHSKPLGNIQLGRTLGDTLAEALGNTRASTVDVETDKETLLKRIAELEAETKSNFVKLSKLLVPPTASKPPETCECGAVYKANGGHLHRRGPRHQKWATKGKVALPV